MVIHPARRSFELKNRRRNGGAGEFDRYDGDAVCLAEKARSFGDDCGGLAADGAGVEGRCGQGSRAGQNDRGSRSQPSKTVTREHGDFASGRMSESGLMLMQGRRFAQFEKTGSKDSD
jgi:hypothetical protein